MSEVHWSILPKSSSSRRRAETKVGMFISRGSAAALSNQVKWQALALESGSSCSNLDLMLLKVSATLLSLGSAASALVFRLRSLLDKWNG